MGFASAKHKAEYKIYPTVIFPFAVNFPSKKAFSKSACIFIFSKHVPFKIPASAKT